MNKTKLLNIMPYILGGLILILVVVIIFSGLKGSDDPVDKIQPVGNELTPIPQTNADNTGDDVNVPDETVDIADGGDSFAEDDILGPVVVPDDNKTSDTVATEPEPTAALEPTAAPTPVPVITDPSMGYTFEPKADYVDTKNGVNLRMAASTDSTVVTKLEIGKRLERTGYNEEWTRVIYDGQECYIATRLIVREVASIDEGMQEAQEPEQNEEPVQNETGADNSTSGDNTVAPDNGSTSSDSSSDSESTENAGTAGSNEKVPYYGAGSGKTVCIDPGAQAVANKDKEPVGPDADTLSDKATSGIEGTTTGNRESEINLAVALKLKAELEARGYKVVMTRTSNDVNISQSERAEIANSAHADAFIHIGADSNADSSVNGMSAICMSDASEYNGYLYNSSRKLSESVLEGVTNSTGANKRYVWETNDKAAINWSDVPVTIVEIGFLTNEKEDKLLATDDYKSKIAAGISDGLDLYFSK